MTMEELANHLHGSVQYYLWEPTTTSSIYWWMPMEYLREIPQGHHPVVAGYRKPKRVVGLEFWTGEIRWFPFEKGSSPTELFPENLVLARAVYRPGNLVVEGRRPVPSRFGSSAWPLLKIGYHVQVLIVENEAR